MPDTPDNTISRAIRPKTKAGQALAARYGKGNVANAILAIEAEAAEAYIDTLTAAVDMSHAWTPCTVCGSMPDDPEAAEPCEEPNDA